MSDTTYKILPFSSQWAVAYKNESEKIKVIFGEHAVKIHHIGSTSVEGLSAKPIIDILIETDNIDVIDSLNSTMQEFGYIPEGVYLHTLSRFFRKRGNGEECNVHVYPVGHEEVYKLLTFRDYLRVHPDEVAAYAAKKKELTIQYPDSYISYREAKRGFVEEIKLRAFAWER